MADTSNTFLSVYVHHCGLHVPFCLRASLWATNSLCLFKMHISDCSGECKNCVHFRYICMFMAMFESQIFVKDLRIDKQVPRGRGHKTKKQYFFNLVQNEFQNRVKILHSLETIEMCRSRLVEHLWSTPHLSRT